MRSDRIPTNIKNYKNIDPEKELIKVLERTKWLETIKEHAFRILYFSHIGKLKSKYRTICFPSLICPIVLPIKFRSF